MVDINKLTEGYYWYRLGDDKWMIKEIVYNEDGELMLKNGINCLSGIDEQAVMMEVITPDEMPTEELDNVIGMFWMLLQDAESTAWNKNDAVGKHTVRGAYKIWNRVHKVDIKPRLDEA